LKAVRWDGFFILFFQLMVEIIYIRLLLNIMANPRVFISSTCYDLSQIRVNLSEFIFNFHYESILSERGDIFFHPDLHTHDCCIGEIENCNLFILIIGGRFGGNYKSDIKKSITNAEYEAARIKNIPVFTFIKREVYEDHRVYQKNKNNKEIIDKIIFPSIEKQEYAKNIFDFIDSVRLSSVNNGFCSFEYFKDIEIYLKKQWAGMMFNFLSERAKANESKIVINTLDNLTLLNKKTEELLENILKKVNPETGIQQIGDIDNLINTSKFYIELFKAFNVDKENLDYEEIAKISPKGKSWYEYAGNIKGFRISNEIQEELKFAVDDLNLNISNMKLLLIYENRNYWNVENYDNKLHNKLKLIETLYKNIINTNKQDRLKALQQI